MCGICGFTGLKDDLLLYKMCAVLAHRGPDQAGTYTSGDISLGHRRLSIIDLSPQGRQPMCNEDGTIWMVVNGEIYNFKQLKEELISFGHIFRSQSDSETIIHAYEQYGEDFVLKLDGMFAIAIWDSEQKKLVLARDRLGIKPLYYTDNNSRFLFASEIKAILQDDSFGKELNEDGFFQYLAFQCIITPETMFKRVYKLEPACILTYRDGTLNKKIYWSLDDAPGIETPENELLSALTESVRSHLVSDVPVGVLLSGGLDSSSIVALMHELGIGTIDTFTVGFDQPDDELAFARQVAEQFNTKHHEIIIKPTQLKGLIEKIVWHMDEPLADGGAIATYLAAQKIRDFVKVVLVGEGGDETLGGYNWYKLSTFPFKLLPESVKKRLYFYLTTYYKCEPKGQFEVFLELFKKRKTFFDSMAAFEIKNILPNSLLMKVDKMTMAHSLEARVPFLDHKFVALAMQVNHREKISLFSTKRLLRKIMKDRLPPDVLTRRKRGFILPVNTWLDNELNDFAHDILCSSTCKTDNFLPKSFKKKLFEKRCGLSAIENKSLLWRIFIFEIWYKKYFNQK